MSLINDALKKAQRQRGDTAAPAPTALSAAPMPGPLSAAPSRNPSPASRPQFLLIGAGAALGLLLSLGAIFLFRPSASEPAAPAPTSAAAPAEQPPASTATTSQPPAAVAQTSHTAAPAAPAPSLPSVNTPPPVREEPQIITVSTQPAAPLQETAKPAGPPPRPALQLIHAVEAFRIAGVRASGADSKVLMNDRVYRIGDVVDHALGIRITAVTANSVTFADESGATCTRNF